jgi:hypothetical protein
MAAWGWVLVGVGGFLALSLLLSFALARILGRLAQDVTELLEQEEWSSAPLTRTLEAPGEVEGPAASPKHAGESSQQRS